jgi:hypothetical protein
LTFFNLRVERYFAVVAVAAAVVAADLDDGVVGAERVLAGFGGCASLAKSAGPRASGSSLACSVVGGADHVHVGRSGGGGGGGSGGGDKTGGCRKRGGDSRVSSAGGSSPRSGPGVSVALVGSGWGNTIPGGGDLVSPTEPPGLHLSVKAQHEVGNHGHGKEKT